MAKKPDETQRSPAATEAPTLPTAAPSVKLYVIIGKQIYLEGKAIGESHATRGAAREQINKLNKGGR